jgi:hypothetical protein
VGRTLPDVRGPGLKNIDLALLKNFRETERASIQFRAEAFSTRKFHQPWNAKLNVRGRSARNQRELRPAESRQPTTPDANGIKALVALFSSVV